MTSKSNRLAAAARKELLARYRRVRAGTDVGFGDPAVSQSFREACGGVWMTVEPNAAARSAAAGILDPRTVLAPGDGCELPFEDRQFEVVMLAGEMLAASRECVKTLIRESHRVLQGGGCLIFAADENALPGGAWTQRTAYELLRDGFDVVGFKRPPWWRFGLDGRILTVCARRKNWRNRSTPIVGAAMPVSAAMLSPRNRPPAQ